MSGPDGVGLSGATSTPPAGYEGVRSRPIERPAGVRAMSPDHCPHEEFAVRADVNRLTDLEGAAGRVIGYDLEIAVDCVACDIPFEFVGLPLGLSPAHPTGTFDGLTLTAPVRPYGSHPDFGLDRLGYSVNMYVAEPGAGLDGELGAGGGARPEDMPSSRPAEA